MKLCSLKRINQMNDSSICSQQDHFTIWTELHTCPLNVGIILNVKCGKWTLRESIFSVKNKLEQNFIVSCTLHFLQCQFHELVLWMFYFSQFQMYILWLNFNFSLKFCQTSLENLLDNQYVNVTIDGVPAGVQ